MAKDTKKRVPWGGVAVPIGQHGPAQAFCFLPLNVKVPFVVSINGYFDVPSNRQTIIGHQTSTENDDSGKWNGLLIQHAISQAYISLLHAGAILLEQKKVTMEWYTALFPSVHEEGGFWALLAKSVFAKIGERQLIPVDPEKNVAGNGSPVMECSKVLYAGALPKTVEDFVEKSGLFAFSTLPRTISRKIPNLREFGAPILREILLLFVPLGRDQINYGPRGAKEDYTVLNNAKEVLDLLSFCYNAYRNDVSALKGLPLLPLASETIGVIGRAPHFIATFSALFPTRKDLFVSADAVWDPTIGALSLDQRNSLQLHVPNCPQIESSLHYSLPNWWRGQACVAWDRASPTPQWVDTLWKFMAHHKDYTTFHNWPLIPTNNGLVRMDKGKSVLLLHESYPKILRELLQRAGCHIYTPVGDSFNLSLLSTPKPGGLCRAFAEVPGILQHQFTVEEADALRCCLETVEATHLPIVKSLRIFPDNQGNLVAIHGREWKAIGVKSQIELENESFLVQEDETCKNLYKLCEIQILTEGKLHNHILQHWDTLCANLSTEKQYECLDIIRISYLKKAKPSSKTIGLLREIAFVVTDKEGGQKKRACELYNPQQELYSAAFDEGEGKFPGGKYASAIWIQFLYRLGLKGDPTSESISAIEACAESICEKIGQHFQEFSPDDDSKVAIEQLNTLKSRAKILMLHMATSTHRSDKLQRLKFVVVDRDATDLPKYCGATMHFTSFAKAVHSHNLECVWILRPGIIDDIKFYDMLTLPSASQIITNLLEFCTKPIDWTHDALRNGRLAKVFAEIYKKIQMQFDMEFAPNDRTWERLRDEKWVLVSPDNQPEFARPAEIFCEIPATFPGYFYKMPPEFESKKLLKHFGMQDSPTYAQICKALEDKAQKLNGEPLDPNDFVATKKLLKFLSKMEPSDKEKTTVIYAPNSQRIFRDISQLVMNNTPSIFESIDNEVAKIDFLSDLDLSIAWKLHAKSLADVVKMAPDPEQLGEKMIHTEYTQKINSEDFVNSVLRIVNHERSSDYLKEIYISKVKSLRSVKIMECDTIVYQYIYNKMNITKIDTQKPQNSGIDTQLQEIYLRKGLDPVKVAVELTERLNHIMGYAVQKESMLTRLLQAEQSELLSVCDELHIPVVELDKTMKLGEELTQHDQFRIRENPLYTFKPKEYVAWKDGNVHRYGRIRSVNETKHLIDLKSVLQTSYEVEVGPFEETKKMGVFNLFKFTKKLEDNEIENEEEEESANCMHQLLASLRRGPDEYFSQSTPEERKAIVERIYKTTIEDERFKKSAGVVESFITHQLQHYTPEVRTKKLKLSFNSQNQDDNNNNNNNNNDNNNNNEDSQTDEEIRSAYQKRVIQQWKQEIDYKHSLARNSSGAQNAIDLEYAQRAITQIQNDQATLLFLNEGNATGTMSDAVCFHAHQLLEKSLKAAIACVPHSATIMREHSLAQHLAACEVPIRENPEIISAVEMLESFYLSTRYLEHHASPMVTRDAFTKQQADSAVEHSVKAAGVILYYVQQMLSQ
eukprot:Phypoly_transcript_00416.p1 GENE.Phypoly_transcript_00416~~Phypoly_transcript_00416.p1  ORF type:complete len:1612 (+),score=288.10 Phypoly_transcript_00416:266-4837(+)